MWKQELGRLKDYQLEVKFKRDVTPRICKPRTVPFAVQEDLNQAYDAGIAKGIWEPTIFNDYGTPVVPVRKQSLPYEFVATTLYSSIRKRNTPSTDAITRGSHEKIGRNTLLL